MGCAYVILAHHDASHLEHLTSALSPAPIFLHVDASVPKAPAARLYDASRYAHRVERYPTSWASWGLVEATLAGLRVALGSAATHIVLISGQDFPLLSSAEIDSFFDARPGVSAIKPHALPVKWLGKDGAMNRVRFWHTPVHGRKVRSPIPRRLPRDFHPYFGQQWCVLSREAAAAVLEVHKDRKDLARFYRHVWIPDEGYLPSLFMLTSWSDQRLHASLWFTRWGSNAAHPKTLTDDDLADLHAARSGPTTTGDVAPIKLFARKFSSAQSSSLRARIEAEFL
jgi:hypothetical protein